MRGLTLPQLQQPSGTSSVSGSLFSFNAAASTVQINPRVTRGGVRSNVTASTNLGKVSGVDKPFTIVIVASTPATVSGIESFRIASTTAAADGLRIDATSGSNSTIVTYTANGVANGTSKPLYYSAHNEAPLVIVTNWSAAGHNSWAGKVGDTLHAWTDAIAWVNPVGASVFVGKATNPMHYYAIVVVPGSVSRDRATELIANPWQLWESEQLLGVSAAAAATATTLSGPSSGTTGVASTNFTVGANGTITGTVTVTPSDAADGGTFTPTSVAISSGTPTATFTYTPASTGVKTISISDDGGLTDATSLSYTSNAAASGYAPALFTMRNP